MDCSWSSACSMDGSCRRAASELGCARHRTRHVGAGWRSASDRSSIKSCRFNRLASGERSRTRLTNPARSGWNAGACMRLPAHAICDPEAGEDYGRREREEEVERDHAAPYGGRWLKA